MGRRRERMTDAKMYKEIKRAFEDFLIPELRAIQEDLRQIGGTVHGVGAPPAVKVDTLWAEMLSVKDHLRSEIRRLDARIDGVDRNLRTAIGVRERLTAL